MPSLVEASGLIRQYGELGCVVGTDEMNELRRVARSEKEAMGSDEIAILRARVEVLERALFAKGAEDFGREIHSLRRLAGRMGRDDSADADGVKL